MEVKVPQSIKLSSRVDTERFVNKPASSFLQLRQRCRERPHIQMVISTKLVKRNGTHHKPLTLEASCAYKKRPVENTKRSKRKLPQYDARNAFNASSSSGQNLKNKASILEPGGFPASLDEALILKNKAYEIESYLNGRSIYLVGMMGSGKTTVGRILSDVLQYSFFDCDLMIEQAAGGISVANIFEQHGEGYFRDNETEALRKLSSMQRLVVSTGGGAVVRPINWKYMRRGISVWLDVPLEALARRITAVGTKSRPLLHQDSGDAYSKTITRLSTLLEERGGAYANANARVSLEYIAAKLGYCDVNNLTPAAIAIEALGQIESFLKEEEGIAI